MTRPFLSALFGFVLCVCRAATGEAATAHAGQVVMGTVLQITVVADDPSHARRMTIRAMEIARHWDDVLTTWRPEGELARLNAAAGKRPQPITADLASALTIMSQLSYATDGAFDPGVGPLVTTYSRPRAAALTPTPATRIREALKVDGTTASLLGGAALDAGGIGKGIALDAIAEELRAAGVSGAYLDFGGSSQLAFGTMENGAPWTLALAGLELGGSHGLMRLDGALSTSRSRPLGDETGPIVNPYTGRVVAERRFVTCYATSATQAEACSKAFVVLGWAAYELPRRTGWEALYEDADGLHVSSRFASMISGGSVVRASRYDSIAPNKMRK